MFSWDQDYSTPCVCNENATYCVMNCFDTFHNTMKLTLYDMEHLRIMCIHNTFILCFYINKKEIYRCFIPYLRSTIKAVSNRKGSIFVALWLSFVLKSEEKPGLTLNDEISPAGRNTTNVTNQPLPQLLFTSLFIHISVFPQHISIPV